MPPANVNYSDSDLESVLSAHEHKPKPRRNSTGPKYFCTIEGCQKSFKRLDHLDRHEYHHTGIKKHACTYEGCGKTYSIVTHLKRHLRCTHERTGAPLKNVPCSIEDCGKMFRSVCNMQRHIREVHENPKVYHCPHCNEKFTQRLKMRRHEISKHTKQFPFNCTKCQKGFYQEWQYERHVANCKVYPCPNCSLQFDKWSLYIKHCRETQHGRKYCKCEHCGQVFAKPGELKKHMAAKHLDEELKVVYRCTHEGCTRSYAYERNLKQHQLTAHSGRRFECTTEGCERFFSSAQNLQKHLDRHHGAQTTEKTIKTQTSTKTMRKKRKDAGQSVVSNLSKLSGLAVDKELDKLLREREPTALEEVSTILSNVQDESMDHESDQTVDIDEPLNPNPKAGEAMELESLIAIALQE